MTPPCAVVVGKHHARVIACSHYETLFLSNAGDVLVSRHVGAVMDDATSMALSCFDDVHSLSRQMHGDSLCGSSSAAVSWENHHHHHHHHHSKQQRRSQQQGLLGGSADSSGMSEAAAAAPRMTTAPPPPQPTGTGPRPPLVPVGDTPVRRNPMTTTTTGHNNDPRATMMTANNNAAAAKSSTSLADLSPQASAEDDGDGSAMISLIQSFDYSQFYEGGNGMLPASATTTGNGNGAAANNNNNNKARPTSSTTNEVDNKSGGGGAHREMQTFLHGIPTFCQAFTNIKIGAISAHPLGAHVLLISKAGLLYSFGANQRGQLGIGVAGSAVPRPTIVTPLLENGGKATACAAGVFHSLVVVENRRGQDQLYGFGRHDVLGLVRPSPNNRGADVVLPRRVQLRGSHLIAASRDHSAAIHNDGSLYVWSVNDKPMVVDLHGERAVDVSLGPSTTLVVTESGTCYSAGSSDCGMLGQGMGLTDAERFVKIDMPRPVVGVTAGVRNVVAWTDDGEAYGWGDAVETPQRVPIESPIVQATAGRDCCLFVAKNGTVWSSGRASGRLGLGDVTEEVIAPRPLYGGLRLWYCQD